jgi:hypothetical protein
MNNWIFGVCQAAGVLGPVFFSMYPASLLNFYGEAAPDGLLPPDATISIINLRLIFQIKQNNTSASFAKF